MSRIMITVPKRFASEQDIESILCLAVLIAAGELPPDAEVKDAMSYWEKTAEENCSNCRMAKLCLACIINE